MPRSAARWARLRTELAAVERWLLPAECVLCARTAEPADALICDVCRSRWRPLPFPRCARCGQPGTAGIECRVCEAWPPGVGPAESAVWLDESARQAVHLLKYDGWWRAADGLARAMAALPALRGGGRLVPVPLGPSRERRRGYNQSAVLARSLGRLTGLPVASDLVRRGRETPTQTSLTPEGRAANVRGAFVVERPVQGRLILVDDVFTTGATLVAAAVALRAAGAGQVAAVTFARAELPLAAVGRSI